MPHCNCATNAIQGSDAQIKTGSKSGVLLPDLLPIVIIARRSTRENAIELLDSAFSSRESEVHGRKFDFASSSLFRNACVIATIPAFCLVAGKS
jgi:hypothetical protein